MGKRGFVSLAVLATTAGLLLGAVLLAGRPTPPAVTAPAVALAATNVQGPPAWAQKVLQKDPSGNWRVSWDQIATYLTEYTFDPNLGEKNHKLVGQQAFASIFPVGDVWMLDRAKLFAGHVIARIESTDQYAALGLIKGNNYLYVWKAGKKQHMVVLNELGRKELKFEHVPHGEVSRVFARDILAGRRRNPGNLSTAALTCITKGWKACFVDSQDVQATGDGGSPGAMGLIDAQGGGGSQPWVACTLYGCCCGGTQCHKD